MGSSSKPRAVESGKNWYLDIFSFIADWRRWGEGDGGRGFESHHGLIIFLEVFDDGDHEFEVYFEY
jgi:hypothetical protein